MSSIFFLLAAAKKGKFTLEEDDDTETTPTMEQNVEIELSVSDMLETVLIT